MANAQETIDRLSKLGFKTASERVKKLIERKRKLALAYEHFRVVRPEKIQAFNEKLKKETYNGKTGSWKTLSFTPVESYEHTPPDHVLSSIEKAIDLKCFDSFEVAHIIEVRDPIVFGRINGCPDRFFIDQWDSDVKIEDILSKNEG